LDDNKLIDMIIENHKDLKSDVKQYNKDTKELINQLRTEVNNKFDNIISKMVTKESCNQLRDEKKTNLEVTKAEISYKKVIAIGSIITGSLTALFAGIMGVIKLFQNI